MKYSIEKVTTLIGARRIGEADAQIGWLLTDSRSLCFPEETLFFALRSSRNDGHRYIDDLYRRGVRKTLISWLYLHHWQPYSDWPSAIATSSTCPSWVLQALMVRRW